MIFRTVGIISRRLYYFPKFAVDWSSSIFPRHSTESFSFECGVSRMFNPREFGREYFTKIEVFFMWLFNAKDLYKIHTLKKNKVLSSSWVSVDPAHLSKATNKCEYIDDAFYSLDRCNHSKLWSRNI